VSGTLVLDSGALSKLSRRHRDLTVWLDVARTLDLLVVTSAATLVQAPDPKLPQAAFDHAVDATLAATAHLEHGDVTVVTSDVGDLRQLCHARVAVEQA
jgi:hypothetical protein